MIGSKEKKLGWLNSEGDVNNTKKWEKIIEPREKRKTQAVCGGKVTIALGAYNEENRTMDSSLLP